MPELPEVEVTARELARRFAGSRVRALRIFHRGFRLPVSAALPAAVLGQPVEDVGRRGKYLLWQFPNGVLLSHLGMSGAWRIHEPEAAPPRRPHDHVEIECADALARLNDPRRFGLVLWHPRAEGDVAAHPLLATLGIEPFDPRFDADWLVGQTRNQRSAIKSVLLAGRVVVGVGNIYASETLFEAGIHPATPAGRISRRRYVLLADAVRRVLAQAIAAGGSTLRDFSGADGVQGHYTNAARVYGRAGEPCLRCGTPIRRIVQTQRATYFCPTCQKS